MQAKLKKTNKLMPKLVRKLKSQHSQINLSHCICSVFDRYRNESVIISRDVAVVFSFTKKTEHKFLFVVLEPFCVIRGKRFPDDLVGCEDKQASKLLIGPFRNAGGLWIYRAMGLDDMMYLQQMKAKFVLFVPEIY